MTPTQITALRKRLGLSLEEFAVRLGVSYFTVYRWEAGLFKPSRMALEKLQALAKEKGE